MPKSLGRIGAQAILAVLLLTLYIESLFHPTEAFAIFITVALVLLAWHVAGLIITAIMSRRKH